MPLISYKPGGQWENRKDYYKWIEDQGFDLNGQDLCHQLHMTSPVLCKYLGRFDYVRRRVEHPGVNAFERGIPDKQVAFFRSHEVHPYLQKNAICTRRTRLHVIPEDVEKRANDEFQDVMKATKGDLIVASIKKAAKYRGFGYQRQIAWLLTPSGQFRVSKFWYKFPAVDCETPAEWYTMALQRSNSKERHRDMMERDWFKTAAIKIEVPSTTTDQRFALHWLPDYIVGSVAVPACYSDRDLYGNTLPELPSGYQIPVPEL